MLIAQEFLGDDASVMYLGDNMLEQGLTEFVERFDDRTDGAAAQILLAEVDDLRGSASPSWVPTARWSARREAVGAAVEPGARGRVPVRSPHP
ncbi:MAG: hypothetical protein R2699_04830 [Acidimicrobiales bacterium]